MGESMTEEQFVRALRISTTCATKGWNHSTDMKIASIIASSRDKEDTISRIESIVATNNESDSLKIFEDIFGHQD